MKSLIRIAALAAVFLCLSFVVGNAEALWPARGDIVLKDNELTVDASHADQGYVMAYPTNPTKHHLKLRIKNGKTVLDYDLKEDGTSVVIPLQLGSGAYEVSLFINVKGKKYSAGGKLNLDVQLASDTICFLYPNQYVDYNLETAAVQKANELAGGLSKPEDIYRAVTGFIESEFSYDFVRAKKIKAAVLPEIDGCFESRAGVCQDLSAVMVCMLRTQGVPAKLMIGYVGKYYHAWTTAYVDGKEVFYDPTEAIGALAMKNKKYKTERFY